MIPWDEDDWAYQTRMKGYRERAERALALRDEGLTYRAIGEALGMTVQRARAVEIRARARRHRRLAQALCVFANICIKDYLKAAR